MRIMEVIRIFWISRESLVLNTTYALCIYQIHRSIAGTAREGGGHSLLLRKILAEAFSGFENFGGWIFSKFGELTSQFSPILEKHLRHFFWIRRKSKFGESCWAIFSHSGKNMLGNSLWILRKLKFGESYWTIFSDFVYSHIFNVILCTKTVVSKIDRRIKFKKSKVF
jgi:hypothetical protein